MAGYKFNIGDRVRVAARPKQSAAEGGSEFVIAKRSNPGYNGGLYFPESGHGAWGHELSLVEPASKPVFPFKEGDVVVCLNDAAPPSEQDHRLTRGKMYTVLATSRRARPDCSVSDVVFVKDNHGNKNVFHAARFCAPDEYPTTIDTTVTSGLQDRLSAAEARIKDLEAQRTAGRKREVELETKLEAQRLTIAALSKLAGIQSGEVMQDTKDGSMFVVLTKAAE